MAKKVTRKGGRPPKSLAQLEVSGGYDRNPGRFLKRMGIAQHQPGPDPAEVAAWDEYERRFGPLGGGGQRTGNNEG